MRMVLFYVLLTLSWLNPFAPGPSAAMVPWLVSLACVAAVLWAAPMHGEYVSGLSRGLIVFFCFNVAYFTLQILWQGGSVEGLATLVVWSCVVAMAVVGTNLARLGMQHAKHRAFETTTDQAQTQTQTQTQTQISHKFSYVQGVAWLWLSVALLSVAIALCQYLRIEHWFSPWISHSGDGTAFANLRQRNQFATLCGMGLLALLYLQRRSSGAPVLQEDSVGMVGDNQTNFLDLPSGAQPPRQATWPWLAATALAIGNALSSSRTGAVQWLLIAAAVWCWRSSLHAGVRRLGYGALGIYAVVVTLMPWFANAVGNASTGLWGRAQDGVVDGLGGNSRVWLYSNVLELIAQKPWLGWGWRELAYAHYSTSFTHRFGELLDNAHNLPLHLAVELGVPFAVLFCGAVLVWIVKSAPWRETDATRQLAWGVLMLIGVHSMVEYPLWYGPFLMTLGLCIGLLQRPVNVKNRPVAQWNIAQAATKCIAVAILAFAAYAGYDYHRVSQIYLSPESRSALYSGDALGAAQQSVLFQRQARFAELVITPVTPATAPRVLQLAVDLVHFSPEPRVIEALIESATMLHFDDVAMFHLARYKEMYPKDYAAWSALK
jgi:Virulence factor membrane-bound polymerase, C-terminal/O-Antigen ligase/Protein glycosylation ligase